MELVHHFSEDPAIMRFRPHVPRTNPTHRPAIWAIDEAHSPLYWFPRDCPRVAAWPREADERAAFEDAFATKAYRLHVIENAWRERVRAVELFRYDFDRTDFTPWANASGQWTSEREVEPVAVSRVGNVIALHERAGIELRHVEALPPVAELARGGPWDFSIVRLANAAWSSADHDAS